MIRLVVFAAAAVAALEPLAAQTAPKVETIATGLDHPWSLAFLPDGRILVTERAGRLRVIDHGKLLPQPVAGVPPVYVDGQGGLFDVVPDPDFPASKRLFLSFAHGTAAANATRVVSARLEGGRLVDLRSVFTAMPAKASAQHFGGRIAFLPDKTLLLTIGEGFRYREQAQRLDSDLGKVVRLTREGTAPRDNPFAGQPGKRAEIYSWGRRNEQGLVYDAERRIVFEMEHGPMGGDEINILKAGANYGWPRASHGVNYDGTPVSPNTSVAGMVDPIVVWVPSIAPSGLAVYRGAMFPEWRGDLLAGALKAQHLRRIRLDAAGKPIGQEILLKDIGERIRDVRVAPDGAVWLVTDSDDGKVLRLSR